jgi:hypothetical protein
MFPLWDSIFNHCKPPWHKEFSIWRGHVQIKCPWKWVSFYYMWPSMGKTRPKSPGKIYIWIYKNLHLKKRLWLGFPIDGHIWPKSSQLNIAYKAKITCRHIFNRIELNIVPTQDSGVSEYGHNKQKMYFKSSFNTFFGYCTGYLADFHVSAIITLLKISWPICALFNFLILNSFSAKNARNDVFFINFKTL